MKLLEFDTSNRLLYYVLISTTYWQICYHLSSANPVCDTPDCKKLADYYKKNMDKEGKPCTDFYDYVCHNWGVHNPRPKYKLAWSVLEWLKRRAAEDIKHALEKVQFTNGTIFDAKALYLACTNLPFMDRADSNTLKKVMAAAGYWPMFATKESQLTQNVPWWQIANYYVSKTGESSFYDITLIANIRHDNQITIAMTYPFSPYGMLKLNAPFHASHRKHYKAFLMHVIESVAPSSTTNLINIIDTDLDDVINFRESIRSIIRPSDLRNGSMMITLKDLQERYDHHISDPETGKINWSELIRSLYRNSKNQYLLSLQNTPTMLVLISYILNLAELLSNTPKRVIVNHIHLYFAEKHIQLTAQMEANLQNSIINDENPTGRIIYEPERWYKCIDSINLGMALGHLYLHAHFRMQSKREVEDLLGKLVQSVKIQVSQSTWLDTEFKNKSIEKLDKLEGQVGYPNWYIQGNKTKTSSLSDVNPININLFYAAKANRVGASASTLQWPIFTPNIPFAVKYGSTGFTIGHEINHALDGKGLKFDAAGAQKDIWPDRIYAKFYQQARCFATQYTKYKKDELAKRNITKTPEFATVNEDLADVMGLKTAYMGYRHELQKNNGTCPILPGFSKFGCEKLFFIAFGNLFCSSSTAAFEQKILLRDTHSLPKTRVNGALGNMKEFHDAFQCKPNDPMVPPKMCDIWK